MKNLFLYILIIIITLSGCSKVRESAGVNRKIIDEFQVIENPPLVIPPDFNLLPPDQLQEKKIEDIEEELAQDILFGLNEKETKKEEQLTTMNQILIKTNALEILPNIRKEIDEDFANEINSNGIFQINWENEIEVLDAIKESERIRNNIFENKSIAEGDVKTKTKKVKNKKKKRFFFF